jgi:tetratricopeptide (TPR) repeat protein
MYEWRVRWAEAHPLIRGAVSLLVLGLLALLVFRPMRNAADTVSASRNLASARESLAAERFAEARDYAQAALDAEPGQAAAELVLLRARDALQDPGRSALATTLLQHRDLMAADRNEAFRVLTRHGAMAAVESAWAGFDNSRKDPGLLASYAGRLLSDGKTAEALKLLEASAAEAPAGSTLHLVHLQTLRAIGGNDSWQIVQKLLVASADLAKKEQRPLPDEVLTIWEEIPASCVDPATADSLADDGSARLRCLRRKILQGSKPIDSADPEIAAWIAEVTPETRLPLAKLLASCGQRHRALALFTGKPPATVAEYEWMRAIRTTAGEWEPWLSILQTKLTPEIPQVLIQSDRAIASAHLGDTAASLEAWRLALSFATGRGHNVTLLNLARRVEAVLPERANEARVMAIRKGEEALPLFDDLTSLLDHMRSTGKESELLDVLKIYRTIEPTHPGPREQLAYHGLLASELSPAQATELVEPVIDSPGATALAPLTLVVAALLDDQPAQARAWINKGGLRDCEKISPVQRWIVLHAEDPAAADQSVALDKTPILPGERSLIERLRARAKAAAELGLDAGKEGTAPE